MAGLAGKHDERILPRAGMDRRCARALRLAVGAARKPLSRPPGKIIVPIGPGGSYDLVGRHLADVLVEAHRAEPSWSRTSPAPAPSWERRPRRQSEPDGYTLLVGGLSNMAFNSALYSKLAYDPLKDFVPVALVYKFGYVMVGRKDLPQAKLLDIVAAAKASPGSISVATAGVGTGQHLVAAAFMKAAGVKLLEVPYRARRRRSPICSRAASTCSSTPIAAGLPYVQSGQARGIAVLSSKRSPLAPDVPTMSEAGVPGLDVDSWLGIFAPAKTPPEVLAKLRRRYPRLAARPQGALREERRRSLGSAGRQARCALSRPNTRPGPN